MTDQREQAIRNEEREKVLGEATILALSADEARLLTTENLGSLDESQADRLAEIEGRVRDSDVPMEVAFELARSLDSRGFAVLKSLPIDAMEEPPMTDRESEQGFRDCTPHDSGEAR